MNHPHDASLLWFQRRAAGYAEASERGVWGLVRGVEARAVLGALGDLTDARVLELGCGAGFYARRLRAAGARRVVGVDRTPQMVAGLSGDGIVGVVADAEQVRLGETFTHVLAAGVLEFVRQPEAALRTGREHVETGARMVVLLPRNTGAGRIYRSWYRRQGIDIHLFDEGGIQELALPSGWSVVRRSAVHVNALLVTLQAR